MGVAENEAEMLLLAADLRALTPADALAAIVKRDAQMFEALEHVTELLVDTWAYEMDDDPETLMAVQDARALLTKETRS